MRLPLLLLLGLLLASCGLYDPAATPIPTPPAAYDSTASGGFVSRDFGSDGVEPEFGDAPTENNDAGNGSDTPVPVASPTPAIKETLRPTPVPGVAELFAQRDYLLWAVDAATGLEDATAQVRSLGQSPRPDDPTWRDNLRQQGELMRSAYQEAQAKTPPGKFQEVHATYLKAMAEFAAAGDQIMQFSESPQSTDSLNRAISLLGRANELIGQASLQLDAVSGG